MCELGGETEPTLAQHLARLAPCDLVIVEGFKREAVPKIEIRRADHPRPLLAPADPWIIAIASDQPVAGEPLPILDLNDPSAIAEFVVEWLGRRDRRPTGDPAGELPC
jgi:molybdopterin-guanine dinucleotide biosynthesis protein B